MVGVSPAMWAPDCSPTSQTATILGGIILAIRAAHYRRQRSIGS
jgi:hypothetical protein